MESMDDYKEELEASLKKIRVGDVVTGTVIDVTDDAVIVDLKAYADGVIRKDDLSEDPDFNMAEMIHPGDEISHRDGDKRRRGKYGPLKEGSKSGPRVG